MATGRSAVAPKPQKEERWSARKKADAVVRLLRGEGLDELSRELRVEAHRLQAWRDEFLAGGIEGLKAKPLQPEDRKLKKLNARSESSRSRTRCSGRRPEKGAPDPAQEAAEIAVETKVARKRVCAILDAPRSTIYAREKAVPRLGSTGNRLL